MDSLTLSEPVESSEGHRVLGAGEPRGGSVLVYTPRTRPDEEDEVEGALEGALEEGLEGGLEVG